MMKGVDLESVELSASKLGILTPHHVRPVSNRRLIGVVGIEPTTTGSQIQRSPQAELHPDSLIKKVNHLYFPLQKREHRLLNHHPFHRYH